MTDKTATQMAAWKADDADDESRAYLQQRLEVFSKLLALSFIVIRACELVLYGVYPHISPRFYDALFVTGVGSLVLLVLCWRCLAGRVLSSRRLGQIDFALMSANGSVFGIVAMLAFDRPESAYVCLIYGCFIVFARAIVVPSTTVRTVIASSAATVPVMFAAFVLAFTTRQDVPGPAFFAGAVVYSATAIVIATIGSRTIYGLRRKVSDGMQLGQYTLDCRIGVQSTNKVYLARHALLRRPTALKLLPDRLGLATLSRFERAVTQMSQLTHPNSIAVFDYGRSAEGVFYYAMEYLDGIDLEQLVTVYGPQPPGRVIKILEQMCGALQESHDRGLVHGDITPANVILCERGGMPDFVKVIDFGLARPVPPDLLSPRHPVLGTPSCIAPEAVADPAAVGPAADLYGCGVVAYFLLTGSYPFAAETPMALCREHLSTPSSPPSRRRPVPRELDEVVMACLAKRPSERPDSAAALARRLRSASLAGWSAAEAQAWWAERRSTTTLVA